MLYGQRDEPGAVLTDLGSRLELGSPETVLSTIVETVSTALKLPGVSIRAADGTTLASTGNTVLEPVRVAILHQGDVQGDLFASPRARDEGLDERDMEVLRLVARQAGPTVHAVQLTQELRRSRQDILSGREEERRRIRRDLHDGLGPALAAIAMQVDTARAIVDDDPDGARDLLSAVTLQAEEVVAEVRRLVYDLRPPALDQLGLVGAIERLAAQTCTSSLTVSVEAAPELPRLPAATEVAVYRIVSEALTNAARHARATLCRVAIHVSEGALSVVIEDDGVGIVPGVARGIGLKSMEDRATEVGGALGIEPRQGGGTTVSGSFRLDSMGQAK
jgi:signal transduction histidine kinase